MTAAVEAHQRWKALCANMHDMERQVLRLMAHPLATPEQVLATKNEYTNMLKDMQETVMALQERYPRKGSILSPAWAFSSLNGYKYEVVKKEKTK